MELRRRFSARTYIVLAVALQLLAAAFGVSALLRPAATDAAQTIPYKINFQGRLTDNSGNVLSDGAYNIKFRFFDAATVGTNKWEGDRVYGAVDNRITVQNGLFNIQFGDTTKGDPALTPALFNTVANGNLWLEVELPTPATATCATNGCAVFTEGAMTPRQPLASSPYAFNADLIDGLDGDSLVQLTPSSQQTGTINVSGTITSGGTLQGNTVDAATSGILTLGASNATSVSLAKNTTLASGLTMTLQGNNALTLGSTTNAGGIVFQDGTVNNRTVTLSAPALGGSYNLNLPNAAPSTDQCLKSGLVTAANLAWATCAATLQDAYASSSTPAQITTTSGTKDVVIKSGVGFNSTTTFRVIPDGTTTPTLNVDTANNRVGVGTAAPAESLDVPGGIKLGTTSNTNAGTIRYSGTDFEGFDGSSWLSLTNGGMVQTTPTVAARKTSVDTSLANTTAFSQETTLDLTIGANESWTARWVAHVNVSAAPDIKFQVVAPAGATCKIGLQSLEETISLGNTACGVTLTHVVAATGDDVFEIVATIANGATPGTVGLQWAPNVSSPTATIFRQNSSMQAIRVSGGTTPFEAFIQGGNGFTATAQLGTTTAQDLSFITGGVEGARLNTTGDLTVTGGLSIGAAEVYAINGVQITSAALSNDAAITKQGNTFNGVGQLIQTTAGGAYPALSGAAITSLNPTNLTTGTGAVTLQPAAAQNLTLTTTGASGLIINPGTTGVTTNLPAGVQAKFTATATPTADLVVIGNTAGQEPTANLINAVQLNWFARPALGNMSSGYRVDVTNNNIAAAGQVQGVRIAATGAGGTVNSDTTGLYIDALANASSGATGENAIEIGSGWDAGLFVQSGGNTISSTTTNSALTITQSANPGAGSASLLVRNTNGAPSGNLFALNNNTATVMSVTATGSATFQPTTDSQTALVVNRSAAGGGTRLFAVDTESTTDPIGVQVGNATSDATQIDLGLDSSTVFADAGTCTTSSNQGALYYNAAASAATQAGSNAIRACTNGAWEDLVSTGGLGILAFGVVPDSGANPGDLPSLVTGSVTGPCKVSWVANAATSTVRIEACTAYSGGRKITIQQNTTFAVPTNVANGYSHICLGATGGITATASNATETANLPALSVGAPVLCLADVRANATANGIQAIYDTRAFINSTKEFVTTAAATSLGVVVIANGTGVGLPGGATVSARGVIVASNGAAAIANAPNAIIATSGPAVAKATAGTAANFVNIAAATGYVTTAVAASATAYANLGYSRNTFPATLCTATPNAANCNRSIFFNLSLR